MDRQNSFWVLYSSHQQPTWLEDAGNGQKLQRDHALRYVKDWRLCADIGSNIGQWTRPLATRFDKVVCFESNPNFRECFYKNISEDNVILHPYALSNRHHYAKQDFNATMMSEEAGTIECRTLDSFELTELDFIKIDVDGFEFNVLDGARQTLSVNSPVINIEMKTDKRKDIVRKCSKLLRKLGYRYVKRIKHDEVWRKK